MCACVRSQFSCKYFCQFVTAGEDAVLNVWSLPEVASGSSKVRVSPAPALQCLHCFAAHALRLPQVELVCSKLVEDHTFTGVQFFKSPRLAILASSYDNNVMVLLQ